MDGEDLTLSLCLRTPIDPTVFVNRSQCSLPRDSCSAGEREKRSNQMDMNRILRLGTDLDEAPLMDGMVLNRKRRSAEREDINEVGSEEEEGENTRKKLRLSKEQSAVLEECFKEHSTLNLKQKVALAKQLNLLPRQVEVWFQNRRARTKLKQTEVDCEYLKRCCENLTEENRRLHKEVLELRALKRSPHLYMQVPPTTLTMCPSCERAAAPENPTAYPFQQQIKS